MAIPSTHARLAHDTPAVRPGPLTPSQLRSLLDDALSRWRNRSRSVAVIMIGLHPSYDLGGNIGGTTEAQTRQLLGRRLTSILYASDSITVLDTGEYVVVCEDLAGPEEAAAIAHRLADEVSRPVELSDGSIFPVVRVGVVLGGPASTADDLLWDAAKAMHHSTDGGSVDIVVFDEHFRAELVERFDANNAIAETGSSAPLELWYQPIVGVKDRSRLSVEALIRPTSRWTGPRDPDQIVAIAEESGRMPTLGEWVLRTAIDQTSRWPQHANRPMTTHINISPLQLRDPQLIPVVEQLLDEYAIPPGLLSFEITENAPLVRGDRRVLAQLKALGVGLCLDDFGKGFSNLGSLRDLPIDVVKLDRSLIGDVARSKASRAIAGAVVGMANTLELEVVAEGIEEAAQLETVTTLGVDYVQGFFLGVAMPAESLGGFAEPVL